MATWSALAEQASRKSRLGMTMNHLKNLISDGAPSMTTRMEGIGDFEELLGEIAEASHNAEKRRDLDSKVQIAIHRICDLSTGFAEAIENTWRA